jgi:methionyl-tRNA synthetase
LRQPLGDLCISRPASRLSWGIPLPFDPDYVTYVWFDALINYVTAAGYLVDEDRFARQWPSALHLIGKDILVTHAVYWPSMLQAAGLSQPKGIFAHGMWVFRGTRLSKSRGNVIRPLELADVYGADAFRYFLVRDMTLGRDADFTEEALAHRYEGDLANDLGNLLHRVVNMVERYCDGRIPRPGAPTDDETGLREGCLHTVPVVLGHVEALELNEALAEVMRAIRGINGYLERTAPWRQAKAEREDRVATSLYHAAEALRLVAALLWPVMPERMEELWQRLGWSPPPRLADGLAWGRLTPGVRIVPGAPLFPREVGVGRAAGNR